MTKIFTYLFISCETRKNFMYDVKGKKIEATLETLGEMFHYT